MRPGRMWLIAYLLVLLPTPSLAGEIEVRILTDGARWRGEDYVRARTTLLKQARQVRSLLDAKLKSEDWRDRVFAAILKVRIQSPGKVRKWQEEVKEAGSKSAIAAALRNYQVPSWEDSGEKAAGVPAPVLVDLLWETWGQGSIGSRERLAVSLQFYLAPDLELAKALLEFAPRDRQIGSLLRQGLLRLGSRCVPVLLGTIQSAPREPDAGRDREAEQLYADGCYRVEIAAEVLSRLGHKRAVPLILDRLGRQAPSASYVGTLSGALARLRATRALDSILDEMFAAAFRYRGNTPTGAYTTLRGHITEFGQAALPVLHRRQKETDKERERILLRHLQIELSGQKGKKLKIASLRETLLFRPEARHLLELHQLTGEDVLERLKKLGGQQALEARKVMAEMKDHRAIPFLLDSVGKQHKELGRILKKRFGDEHHEFDAQKAREATGRGRHGAVLPELGLIMKVGDLDIQTIRRIGGIQAIQALGTIVAFPEYRILAETGILDLENRVGDSVGRLGDKTPAVREAAALLLFERKDRRAARGAD